jgi:DNA-binding response OmpR family regulator
VSAVKEEGSARTGSRRSRSSDHQVVLVVDDEPQVLQLLKRVLERAGFETIAIGDGRAAHEAAVEWRPDIILLDLMLGSITGDQVLTELRKDFRTRLIPVVFLTVRSSIKDKVEHLMAGADDYVTKPFIGEELVARLRAVIMRATTTRELSPLTGMSGNSDILREISSRLVTRDEFAVLYPDIDNFQELQRPLRLHPRRRRDQGARLDHARGP